MNSDVVTRRFGSSAASRTIPRRLIAGLSLVAIFWTVSWLQLRPISNYYFFPLWLGYFLTVDALVVLRTGTSPFERAGWRVVTLFAISVPLWWLFEGFNEVVGNWRYHQAARYATLENVLLSSLAFSTVVPAVLTTAELVRSFRLDPLRRLPRIEPTPALLTAIFVAGWVMVGLTLGWPELFFPLVWLSVVFILDPVATWLGGRSLAWHIGRGDWSPLFTIALGTLICGWFWEMWNIYSMPKWTYSIPYLEHLHIFEMPLAGYGGYIPFGYEVYLFVIVVGRLLPVLNVPDVRVSARFD
jgi:hypothetical protein